MAYLPWGPRKTTWCLVGDSCQIQGCRRRIATLPAPCSCLEAAWAGGQGAGGQAPAWAARQTGGWAHWHVLQNPTLEMQLRGCPRQSHLNVIPEGEGSREGEQKLFRMNITLSRFVLYSFVRTHHHRAIGQNNRSSTRTASHKLSIGAFEKAHRGAPF